jgi:hypothetical protein
MAVKKSALLLGYNKSRRHSANSYYQHKRVTWYTNWNVGASLASGIRNGHESVDKTDVVGRVVVEEELIVRVKSERHQTEVGARCAESQLLDDLPDVQLYQRPILVAANTRRRVQGKHDIHSACYTALIAHTLYLYAHSF